jgi:hypothetical protein
MEISILDCVYIISIGVIISWLFYMEVQISQIKAMMEEHVKCTNKLQNEGVKDGLSKSNNKEQWK